MLRRRVGGFEVASILSSGLRSSVAAVVMGLVIYLGISLLDWQALTLLLKILALGCTIVAGVVVYMVLSYILKVPEQAFLKDMLMEKLARRRS